MNEALELCKLCDERTLVSPWHYSAAAKAARQRPSLRTCMTVPRTIPRCPAMFCRRISKLMARFRIWQPRPRQLGSTAGLVARPSRENAPGWTENLEAVDCRFFLSRKALSVPTDH